MPEPFSAERLNQLRQRWERDPKSRAFLQLAEEYRRAGRLPDALFVLKAGLDEHPTYLAAQVALGRCLVETDAPDAAIEILERAVARDPAQLVANKLLVEAYLAKRQAGKARERLDLYKLFNDHDAEIGPLEARIRALGGAALAPAGAARRSAGREMRGNSIFELPALQALPEIALEPGLGLARARATATAAPSDTVSHEPFGALFPRGTVQRIESAFAEQGIFALAPALPAAPAPPASTPAVETAAGDSAAAAPVDWESAAWPTGSAQIEPPPAAPEFFAPTGATAQMPADLPAELPAGLPVGPVFADVEELEAPWPTSQPDDSPRPASSTLGELYLAQGHLDEAEESFQSVLHSRPGDVAALAGLESVRLQRGEEAAAFADDLTVSEVPNVIVGGLTARKAALLKEFLARIRRGAKRHVS